ncbi:hypothetical protein HU200_034731 [Digitaria exilis]|uniref:Uncharacterized protein n=1 Tax=Digitaria exilis TaxID=1010633 RepID=A0A835BTA7_9POAL|nr:hypothetical protein HU200_034731 [Digitaria exilis]
MTTVELEEEQQQLGVMEATPPSPSVFLDLPPAPCIDGGRHSSPEDDDLVLPYISRMLMEEDIIDKFSDRYDDPDHTAILNAQQPFAEILSNAIQTCPCNLSQPLHTSAVGPYFDTQVPGIVFLNGTATGKVETNSLLTDENSVNEVSMAFFKGMEEANKFLPIRADSETIDSCSWKKRFGRVDEVGRSTKRMAAPLQTESEEEVDAREMLDRLMLNGYNPSLATIQEPPHVVKGTGKTPQPGTHTVDLHTMLIRCAEAVATDDRRGAADLLERIKCHSSPTGDSMQRLAYCFAKGLEARLAGTGSQIYRSLMAKRASMVCILTAYQFYMDSCCFLPVKHLFSNKTIYNAVAGRKKLHIVHYGIDPDEVLVINSMLHLQTLMDESVVVERPNPRDMVLSTIRKMRPSVFIHTVNNGSHSNAFFMPRFREALQRYAALFDMMDTIAPREDDKRLLVERDIFARCVTNIIACEGMDRVQRPQSYKKWQARSQRAGLKQLQLDPEILQMIKDKVKEYHMSFMINEDQRWLLLGWKGRVLYALSTWTANDNI